MAEPLYPVSYTLYYVFLSAVATTIYFSFLYFVVFPKKWCQKNLPLLQKSPIPLSAYHKYYCSLTSSLLCATFFFKVYWGQFWEETQFHELFDCSKVYDHWLKLQSVQLSTEPEYWYHVIYFGYLLADSVWLVATKNRDAVQLFHHVYSITGHSSVIFFGLHGWEGTICCSMFEVSSSILNLRGVLKFHGFYPSIKPFMNLAYCLVFTFFRVGVTGAITYFEAISPATRLDMIWFQGIVYSLNLIFAKRAWALVRADLRAKKKKN